MGCGVSQPENLSTNGDYYDSVKLAPNGTGMAPMPPVAEEVSLNILEEATEAPRTGEEGSFELPEGEFVDGKLGIIEETAIEALRSSLAVEELYCDEDFPADDTSIFFSEREPSGFDWMRPSELVSEPELFVDGASRRDVVQGKLGDCWFLSSCAAVARKPKLIERVIPPNQCLYGEHYTGLVICRFWRFGEWVSVCVDDRLPTKDGEILFARSAEKSEFWVAILEKAYAKLHGSYEAMEGGQSMDAMVDLTGGLAERFDMDETPDKDRLYRLLLKSSKNGAFITCSRKNWRSSLRMYLDGDWKMAIRTDKHGLVEGHAYTVSGVARVRHETLKTVKLIRIRNPWANDAEWNGDWADTDSKWDGVSEEQKEKLGFRSKADGEFWMSYGDFCEQFEEVSICTIGPDFDHDGTVDYVGQVKAIKGEWAVGESAGGSRNDFDSFATNPQYLLTVTEPDDDDDNEGRCSILIGLLQEHRRSQRAMGIKMIQIGFLIYKTDDPESRLPPYHFRYHYEVGSSGTYINYREVLSREELEPGDYVIIPATFMPDVPGNFMVRVYSPKPFELKKIT